MSDPIPTLNVKGGYMELSWLIASNRDTVPQNTRLGLLALRANAVSTAEHWFAQGMESADSEEVLGCIVGLAWVAWQRHDDRESRDLLERAHASGRSDAAFNLGILAEACGDNKLAHYWWEQAGKSAVREIRAAAHQALADIMHSNGEHELAHDHLDSAALQGHGEALRRKVWDCVSTFDLNGLHFYLMLGKSFGDESCEAMYEVAIVDLIREANTDWTSEARLQQLSQHSDWRVRAAVRTNPTTPAPVREVLNSDPETQVRTVDLRATGRYPALTHAGTHHRLFDLKRALERASMEVAVKQCPDNFILQAVWHGMQKQSRKGHR
jgi:hypothetical protein